MLAAAAAALLRSFLTNQGLTFLVECKIKGGIKFGRARIKKNHPTGCHLYTRANFEFCLRSLQGWMTNIVDTYTHEQYRYP